MKIKKNIVFKKLGSNFSAEIWKIIQEQRQKEVIKTDLTKTGLFQIVNEGFCHGFLEITKTPWWRQNKKELLGFDIELPLNHKIVEQHWHTKYEIFKCFSHSDNFPGEIVSGLIVSLRKGVGKALYKKGKEGLKPNQIRISTVRDTNEKSKKFHQSLVQEGLFSKSQSVILYDKTETNLVKKYQCFSMKAVIIDELEKMQKEKNTVITGL